MAQRTLNAFLLTREWQDTPNGTAYEFWCTSDEGPVRALITGQEPVCFVPRTLSTHHGRRAQVELRTLGSAPVDALYFPSQEALIAARDQLRAQGLALLESDVRPVDRYLMERFITGPLMISGNAVCREHFLEFTNPVLKTSAYTPNFTVLSLDIETQGLTGRLYSIAAAKETTKRVFMIGAAPDTDTIRFFPDERSLLESFLAHVEQMDPDLIVGWNVVDFDLTYLAKRCTAIELPFALGRNQGAARIIPPRTKQQATAVQLPGRVVLDGIAALRMAMYSFESFTLDAVSQKLLGRTKLIDAEDKVAEIDRLFHENPRQLAAYNLEDAQLVLDIFSHAKLMEFLVERSKLSGLPLGRSGGSVASYDFLYLPRLHRHGFVAPDLRPRDQIPPAAVPGGHVMDSRPGLYENVLVLDFKSLYPSIIRTFHIDPLAMAVSGDNPIPGFEGAGFSRDTYILPHIIESLWQARDGAKREKNAPLSQAIKILMNSFYGVLGTPGCRFFEPKLAGSITRYGQKILTESRGFIEQQGHDVIYGDTDSVFVLLGPGHDAPTAASIGASLAESLNNWWRGRLREELGIESFLEVEYETHYLRFVMPTIRGSEKGSKKRYAGLVRGKDDAPRVVFKGLESVRTDWTPLAREFQQELYRRVFLKEPFEEYVCQVAEELLAGKRDAQLAYRKRLRKPLHEYQRNIPPHVQAARKLKSPGQWAAYVITLNGPEPVEARVSPIDYAHYLDRQLAPAADSILYFLHTSFQALADKQMELF